MFRKESSESGIGVCFEGGDGKVGDGGRVGFEGGKESGRGVDGTGGGGTGGLCEEEMRWCKY